MHANNVFNKKYPRVLQRTIAMSLNFDKPKIECWWTSKAKNGIAQERNKKSDFYEIIIEHRSARKLFVWKNENYSRFSKFDSPRNQNTQPNWKKCIVFNEPHRLWSILSPQLTAWLTEKTIKWRLKSKKSYSSNLMK